MLLRSSALVVGALLLTSCPQAGPCFCESGCVRNCLDGGAPFDADAAGTGRDARAVHAPDAPVDGDPDDPGWAVLPGVPDGCVIEVAAHPERLPTLEWESCGDGCARAEVPGVAWAPLAAAFDRGNGVAAIGSAPDDEWWIHEIVPVGGRATAALRFHPTAVGSCDIRFPVIGAGSFAAVAHSVGDREPMERIIRGPIDGAAAPTIVTTIAPPRVGSGRSVDVLAVSTDLVAAQITGGSIVALHDGALLDVFMRPVGTAGQYPAAEGDHLVYAEVFSDWRIMHWTPETGTQPYHDPVEPVSEPRLAGGILTWTRPTDFVEGVATRAELWAAPFVRDPALLEPRMVHPDVEPTRAFFADGTYGWLEGNFTSEPVVHLVDVATGDERVLVPPPGLGCDDRGMYVSRGEVMVFCAEGGASTSSLYRFDAAIWARPI